MKDTKPDTHNANYWFKRRRYGYGWIPVTKRGWGVVVAFIIVLIVGALAIKDTPKGEFTKEVGFYLIAVAVMAFALVKISGAKGPKPKWRWGTKSDDNPSEDF